MSREQKKIYELSTNAKEELAFSKMLATVNHKKKVNRKTIIKTIKENLVIR